jgi:cytochrome c5
MRLTTLLLATALLAACSTGKIARRPAPAPKQAWVTYPEAEVKDWKNAHDYKGASLCQRCHARALLPVPRGGEDDAREQAPEAAAEDAPVRGGRADRVPYVP